MKLPYKNASRDSGIATYEIAGPSTLILEFTSGQFRYVYDATTPGLLHVTEMIRLAQQGQGLATYVNQHVRERYASRLPLP